MDLTISSTDIVSPTFRYTWLPPLAAAASEAVTVSCQEILPESMASIIKSRVMTLVTLAGASRSWALVSYRTVPVARSMRTADGAVSCRSTAPAGRTSVPAKTLRNSIMTTIRLPISIPPGFATDYVPGDKNMKTSLLFVRSRRQQRGIGGLILYKSISIFPYFYENLPKKRGQIGKSAV